MTIIDKLKIKRKHCDCLTQEEINEFVSNPDSGYSVALSITGESFSNPNAISFDIFDNIKEFVIEEFEGTVDAGENIFNMIIEYFDYKKLESKIKEGKYEELKIKQNEMFYIFECSGRVLILSYVPSLEIILKKIGLEESEQKEILENEEAISKLDSMLYDCHELFKNETEYNIPKFRIALAKNKNYYRNKKIIEFDSTDRILVF